MSLQPFTLFSFNISACGFVLVGLKIIISTEGQKKIIIIITFLFQRLSVSLQRLNSVLLHDTFVIDDVPGQ